MDRRGWASQVEDLVDLQEQLLHDVVAYQLKVDLADEVRHILLAAREEVVDTDDLQRQSRSTVDLKPEYAGRSRKVHTDGTHCGNQVVHVKQLT